MKGNERKWKEINATPQKYAENKQKQESGWCCWLISASDRAGNTASDRAEDRGNNASDRAENKGNTASDCAENKQMTHPTVQRIREILHPTVQRIVEIMCRQLMSMVRCT